ncbi:hypothetical protein T265_10343 [Opisthorchis viverrini]|uniref:Uncharacterized protein n=1 Tax=Opisthorchis viverrini TaxID=6198 RepID=A0A074Z2T9_OPIVI|nr:hypothetical protein T265_10343 [Opisthorchis viverrini]KER21298.1 hypothetical protein T265_10343 [Opisthorchis viverrini]
MVTLSTPFSMVQQMATMTDPVVSTLSKDCIQHDEHGRESCNLRSSKNMYNAKDPDCSPLPEDLACHWLAGHVKQRLTGWNEQLSLLKMLSN